MDPKFHEYQQISALRYDQGYLLLLEYLKALLDDTTESLVDVKVEEEGRLLAKWRAMREIYATLATAPEKFATIVTQLKEEEEATKGPQMPQRVAQHKKPLPPEEVARLKALYEEKTGKKVTLI